jgi:murein L,D-transpeptidase YafK
LAKKVKDFLQFNFLDTWTSKDNNFRANKKEKETEGRVRNLVWKVPPMATNQIKQTGAAFAQIISSLSFFNNNKT